MKHGTLETLDETTYYRKYTTRYLPLHPFCRSPAHRSGYILVTFKTELKQRSVYYLLDLSTRAPPWNDGEASSCIHQHSRSPDKLPESTIPYYLDIDEFQPMRRLGEITDDILRRTQVTKSGDDSHRPAGIPDSLLSLSAMPYEIVLNLRQ